MTTRESVSERETVTNSIFDETTRITDDYGEVTTDNNEIEDKTKSELFTKSSVDSSEFTNVVFTEITQENIDSTHIQVTNNDNEGGNTNEVSTVSYPDISRITKDNLVSTKDNSGNEGGNTNEASTVSYPDISRITKDNLVSTEDNSGNEGGNTNEASTVSYPDISRITKDNLVSTEDNSGNEGGNTNEASTVSYPDVSKSTATVIGIPTENRKIGTEEPITEIVTEFPSDSTVDTKILSTTGSNGMTSSFNGKFTKTDATTESVKTTAAVITDKPEGILECPEANGLFPHPDPHKWVHCSNWTPHIKDCPGKLVFDKKRKICNWSVSFSQDIPLPPGMKKDCNGQP
ncbi:uncharacterized protein LOC111641923 [Centruroides sculpturatus]|uniref:uncharacterized protein LOC111641923 n=1 Tax=Centruroides sculpturatus TaxID=218467 RepID=UPI000C6DB72C|nr:uncharacterized protein LOC111641923 [Centruroides sculpturatus]